MAEERKKLIVKYDEIPKDWDLEDNKVWFVYEDKKKGYVVVKRILKVNIGKEVIKWMKKNHESDLVDLNAEFDNCAEELLEYIIAKYRMLFLAKESILAAEYSLSYKEYTSVINYALTNNLVDDKVMSHITFFTQEHAKGILEMHKIADKKDRLIYMNETALDLRYASDFKESFKFWIGDICRCITSPPNTNRENAIFGIQRIATGIRTAHGNKLSGELYYEGTDGFLYKEDEIVKLTQEEINQYLFKALSGERFMEYGK